MNGRPGPLARRVREAVGTLTATPWRRAPWLLWRRPGVLAPAAGAAAVLAASLASMPLFLSSAGTEAVALQAAERCPRDTGATYPIPADARDPLATPDPFEPLAGDLGPRTRWARFATELTTPGSDDGTAVVVLFRDGASDHVEELDGRAGPGEVWLSDRAVALAGAGRGEEVELGGVAVPVGGVYRDLAAGTVEDPFWCAHRTELLLRGTDLVPPPPVVLADRATWTTLLRTAEVTEPEAAWEAPLGDEVTVTDARRLVDELGCEGSDPAALAWCIDGERPTVTLEQRLSWTDDQVTAPDAETFVERFFDSSLPFVVDRSHSIQTAVGGGVWPVAALAGLAGAGLVAATALLWGDRRRREVRLLVVRGVPPSAIGLKAVLELGGALLAGSAAGVVAAHALVVGIGPSPVVESGAVGRAWLLGTGAVVLAAAVVALVVTAGVATGARGRGRRWPARVPWELALGGATLVSFERLDAWGVPVSDGAAVSRIDLVGLLFPVLFLATAVAVTARLLVLVLPAVTARSGGWSPSLFLAARRIARYRTAVLGLVAAAALATGVFAYAATLQRSLDASLDAKALVYLGSDVVVRVPRDAELPASFAGRSTSVDLYGYAWVQTTRRIPVNVFAIDPATFEQAAFWDQSLSDTSLAEIVDRLGAPAVDGRVPAVAAGLDLRRGADAGIVTAGTTRFRLVEVADVDVFPGMRQGSPAVFVAASALEGIGLEAPVREVRIRGSRSEVLAELGRTGTGYEEISTGTNVVDAAAFLTVDQTFGFLRTLALAAALLVVGGVAVYLDARRRGRVLAYAFARRMGLTRRQHRRALFVEVAAGVVTGCWAGLVVAALGAGLAHDRIDPLPSVPPAPLLRLATGTSVALAVGAVALTAIAAALAQRATDRDDPVEVLRAGT